VTSMDNMFSSATAFNQDITVWDSSSVSFSSNMFQNAIAWLAGYKRIVNSTSVDGPASNWSKIPPPPSPPPPSPPPSGTSSLTRTLSFAVVFGALALV